MHIILGLLGSIITVLILLNRLAEAGIDIGGLNPYLWHRRRKWRKQHNGNPLFTIEDPMDATAILMVAVAKADGDVSLEEKQLLQKLFHTEFKLSEKDAAGLLISSAFLLGDGAEFRTNIARFLSKSKDNFNDDQKASAIEMITTVSDLRPAVHPNAAEIISVVRQSLTAAVDAPEWGGARVR